jgi:3-mercaptopyruvate sulfurtransferase SseA
MNIRILCIAAGAALALSASTAAFANDGGTRPAAEPERPKAEAPAKENGNGHVPGAQQNKMKHCNEEAKKKELKGDERRAFMSSCLKG